MSSLTEFKEVSGKDRDEDRARRRDSKVKSVFLRDQAPEEAMRVVVGDLPIIPV